MARPCTCCCCVVVFSSLAKLAEGVHVILTSSAPMDFLLAEHLGQIDADWLTAVLKNKCLLAATIHTAL